MLEESSLLGNLNRHPKLNGLMSINDGKRKCENDLACAGFTSKGSYKTLKHDMQMYIEKTHIITHSFPKIDRCFVML